MKGALLLVFVLMLVSLAVVGRSVRPVTAYPSIYFQNITHEGDIILDNDETFTVENSNFTITGNIVVKDNAKLVIHNTNFTITFDIYHGYGIEIQYKAMVNITDSKVTLGLGGIILRNSSVIYISNSSISEAKDPSNQLTLHDNSTAYIRTSIIECPTFLDDNSMIYIQGSSLSLYPGAYSLEGNITVQVRNSNIYNMNAKYSNIHIWNSTIGSVMSKDSHIHIENSKIHSISAYGNSRIVLIHTSIPEYRISAYDSSVVLTTLDFLPFVVLVPYQWVPWIELGIVIAIIVSIGLIIYVIRKQIIKRSLEKELGHPPLRY